MPEHEGYLGIITLLTNALKLMDEGDFEGAKEIVKTARTETVRQAKQSVSSLEIGIDLGQLLSKPDDDDVAQKR